MLLWGGLDENKAAVDSKDQDGKTALMIAKEKGNHEVAKLLKPEQVKQDPDRQTSLEREMLKAQSSEQHAAPLAGKTHEVGQPLVRRSRPGHPK